MLGLILGGLGSAATAAGMGTLGAGLSAAGTMMGGGIPGVGGGAGGLPGVGPGAASPASMPFGFDITKMLNPASGNLGTNPTGGGSGEPGMLEKFKAPIPAAPLPGASQSMQKPVDVQSLLSIINGRSNLGS